MNGDKKEISFELLTEMISNDYNNQPQVDAGTLKFFSKMEHNSVRYDYEAYFRRLKQMIEKHNFLNYIKISKQNTTKQFIPELMLEYFTKYTITIKNCTIKVGMTNNKLLTDTPIIDEYYPKNSKSSDDQYNGGLQIIFKNNTFVTIDKTKNSYLNGFMADKSHIVFDGNKFNGVDLFVGTRSCLDLKNN